MNTDKLWEWGVALFCWFFLLSLLLTLREQWADDDNMRVNFLMFIVMLTISCLAFYGFVLLSCWIYIQLRDIVRTIRSIWWKERR